MPDKKHIAIPLGWKMVLTDADLLIVRREDPARRRKTPYVLSNVPLSSLLFPLS
jgi:hypothetical protein